MGLDVKTRILVTVDDDTLKKLDELVFLMRSNRSSAIRFIVSRFWERRTENLNIPS